MAEDTNKFDAHIRSLLDNATEEVPDKVWLGIEKRLAETGTSDGTGKVRRIPLWLRISGAAAAAAAVAAGLFLTGTLDNAISPGPDYLAADTGNGADFNIMTSSRTETGFPRIIMADIPEARPLAEDIFRKTGPIDAGNAENAAEEDESGIMTEENTVSLGNEYRDSHDQAGAGNDVFESNDISESDEYKDLEQQDDLAAWAELLSEEDGYRRGRRISVTLSGNAISNTNASTSASGSSSIAFRPGKNSLTEDYISQTRDSAVVRRRSENRLYRKMVHECRDQLLHARQDIRRQFLQGSGQRRVHRELFFQYPKPSGLYRNPRQRLFQHT